MELGEYLEFDTGNTTNQNLYAVKGMHVVKCIALNIYTEN